MKQTWRVIAVLVLAVLSACKDRPNSNAVDVQPLEPPILYLNGSSGDEAVRIIVDGNIVWDKVVPMGNLMPNIHSIKIARGNTDEFAISIESNSLREEKKFKWADGLYFSVNFNNYKNSMIHQMKVAPRYL